MANPTTPTMTLAKVRKGEINAIMQFFSEVNWLRQELQHSDLEDVEWGDYILLSKFERSPLGFLRDLCRHASSLMYEKALFNLEALLDNCADRDLDHLDFNSKIKRGLELLDEKGPHFTFEAPILISRIESLISCKGDEFFKLSFSTHQPFSAMSDFNIKDGAKYRITIQEIE